MKMPHSITLFNRFEDRQDGRTFYMATVIKGVLFRLINSEIKATTGDNNKNNAKVFIPINANTENKTYITPAEFEKGTAESNEAHFTFAPEDFIVQGEHPELKGQGIKTADIEEVCKTYRITSAELLDFGSTALQHWEIVAL